MSKPPRGIKISDTAYVGGARHCEEHNRAECTKNRRRGRGVCHGTVVRGTNACRTHGGLRVDVQKARGEANITAWNATAGTATIDYRMAVLGVLQMTWLRLAAYSELLRRQVELEGAETQEALEPDATVRPNGLIGYRYGAAGKEGHIYAQSEDVRALVVLESQERDRVVRYAKTAHDMGISDRLTALAERWGDVVATRITDMLGDLNLTPEQMVRVPAAIQRHLGSIDVEAISAAPNGHGGSKG
jgi:hypothetical protein